MLEYLAQYLKAIYESLMINGDMSSDEAITMITVSCLISLAFLLSIYIVKSIAICLMAKKRGLKTWWWGMIPYLNYVTLGKLGGAVGFFGKRISNAGIWYASFLFGQHMLILLQSISFLLTKNATVFTLTFYQIITGIYNVLSYPLNLAGVIFFVMLCFGLYGKYAPGKRMLLTFLSLFNIGFAITLMVIHNRKPYDSFDEYVKQKTAERFGQSYDPFSNPYVTKANPFFNNENGNSSGDKNNDNANAKDDNPFDEY